MINDWSLDDIDYLIILAIGNKGNKSTKIHKIVLILSKLLNIQMDAEAYYFDGYSETVAERLNSRSELPFFVKVNKTYKLTEQGKELYYKLLEQLRAKNREDVIHILNALHKMSNKNLLALMYFLYPETTEKSVIKEDINKIIESLKEKGKKNFKVEREDNNVTIEIS
jgi:DNA-binding PadR family transcriptional regulator